MRESIIDMLDRLRGQFHRLRSVRPPWQRDYETIAQEMGLTKPTLYRFAHGGTTFYSKTLPLIEAWCEREEAKHGQLVS